MNNMPEAFVITSESFSNGGVIPERLARKAGVSPQLSWRNVPPGTERVLLVMDDPDARPVCGYTWVHWVANVPANVSSLPEGASGGGWTEQPKTLSSGSTSTAYQGPFPPSGTHRYFIKAYAMDRSFRDADFQDLARSAKAKDTRSYTREHIESQFGSSILASAEISGTYSAP
jgi:Raf kinase inhibitor-like YbhB/YbcL family protein